MHMSIVQHAYRSMRTFHKSEFRELGAKTEVLWKGGKQSQVDRFEQILRLAPSLHGCSLLDVGCGFADLYSYLEEHGVSVRYTGFDLCEEMIEVCQQRYPEASFWLGGVIDSPLPPGNFDVAVASGIFNFSNPDWDAYVVETVKKMFQLSTQAVVVNFLSSFSQSPSSDSYYVEPNHVLQLLMREVSPWVTLAHDYRWNDMTVAVYHRQQRGGSWKEEQRTPAAAFDME